MSVRSSRWFALASLWVAVSARAQGEDRETRAERLFADGNALMERNQAEAAAEKYRASWDLVATAKAALNLGIALAELGRDAGAAEAFSVYLDDPLSDPAKRPIIQEQLRRLRGRVGTILIQVDPPDPAAEISVDGVRPMRRDRAIVEPGRRQVSARRVGYADAGAWVSVAAGGEVDARLALAPIPAERAETGGVRRTWKWIAFSAAAAAAAVGTYFGVLAISRWNDVDELCPDGACTDPGGLERADEARHAGNVATAAFVVSGGAVVAGVVLWLTEPKVERGRPGVTAAPIPGGGMVWVVGGF